MTLTRPGELTKELPVIAHPRALFEMVLAGEAEAEKAGELLDRLLATDEKEIEANDDGSPVGHEISNIRAPWQPRDDYLHASSRRSCCMRRTGGQSRTNTCKIDTKR